MAHSRRWQLVCVLTLAAAVRVAAETQTESAAFEAASRQLQGRFWSQAEAAFAGFARDYPASTRLPEAYLLEAEARFQQTNYAGVNELLSAHQAQSGNWAHEYLYWEAQAWLGQGDYPKTIQTFSNLVQQFPGSPHALEAVLQEAGAEAKLGEWERVIALLQQTNGVFLSVSSTNATNDLVLSGDLLLAQARFTQRDYGAAEAILQPLTRLLQPLANPAPNASLAWRLQYLMSRIRLAQGRSAEALQNMTNLLSAASTTNDREVQAETFAFEAELLEQAGRVEEAIAAYTNNLVAPSPSERQRQALLQITRILLDRNRAVEALQRLEEFRTKFPAAPAADLALLTLGKLRLGLYLSGLETNRPPVSTTNATVETNDLQRASNALAELTKNFPKSAYLGRAELYLGWCFWLAERWADCQDSCKAALEQLPVSMDQALARFKLADAQLQQSNCIGALTNYMMILERYDRLPEVKTNLFEPALYQAVRAALGAGDLAAATNALSKLLAWYPDGFHTQPAALLIGENLARHGDSAAARRLFQDFAGRSAGALPEVGLAIARTYEEEGRWTNAIGEYDQWLQRFPDNRHAPSARFYLAQANASAGNETNALTLFTNFVAHFPTNDLTPLARWWAADYFLRNDKPIQAEEEFRLLWLDKTNSPGSEIPFQACLMAGRAAVKEESYPRAIEYFTNLTGDVKHCPADLWIKAMFAYGDTLVLMGDAASTNKLENYDQARSIFSLICKTFPTNAVTPLALGRMADCLVQSALAAHPYGNLTNAAQVYQQVIDSPYATVGARSQARIAQGFVLEKQAEDGTAQARKALLQAALAKYLEVWSGRNLGPGERAESFWFKKAGLEAARVAEEAGEWDQARGLYEQLQQMLPASRASLARSMIRASEKIHPQ